MSAEKYDFSEILKDTPAIQEYLKEKNKKKIVSSKPLSFIESDEDSPIKVKLIEIINSRNLTYSDLYTFCTERNGDNNIEKGRLDAQNYILGLRDRPKMYDKTISGLCKFLNVKIILEDRKEKQEYSEELKSKLPNSVKPLKFEIDENASDIKKMILNKINESNLLYRDLYLYCMAQDLEKGKDDAMNLINGLRCRNSMYDTTFCILADFLNCNILIEEEKGDEENE